MSRELEICLVWKYYTDLVVRKKKKKRPIFGVKRGVRKHYTTSHGQGLGDLQMAPLGDSDCPHSTANLGS